MTINKINFRSTLAALAFGALVTVIPAAADTVSFTTSSIPQHFGCWVTMFYIHRRHGYQHAGWYASGDVDRTLTFNRPLLLLSAVSAITRVQ